MEDDARLDNANIVLRLHAFRLVVEAAKAHPAAVSDKSVVSLLTWVGKKLDDVLTG
jgi:hypothetical protein